MHVFRANRGAKISRELGKSLYCEGKQGFFSLPEIRVKCEGKCCVQWSDFLGADDAFSVPYKEEVNLEERQHATCSACSDM